MEHFREDTLERWYGKGLSPDVCLNDYFDFDIIEMGIDASPRFDAWMMIALQAGIINADVRLKTALETLKIYIMKVHKRYPECG